MLSIAQKAENDNFPWLIVNLKLLVLKDKMKDTFDFKIAQRYQYFSMFSRRKWIIQHHFTKIQNSQSKIFCVDEFYFENVKKFDLTDFLTTDSISFRVRNKISSSFKYLPKNSVTDPGWCNQSLKTRYRGGISFKITAVFPRDINFIIILIKGSRPHT